MLVPGLEMATIIHTCSSLESMLHRKTKAVSPQSKRKIQDAGQQCHIQSDHKDVEDWNNAG